MPGYLFKNANVVLDGESRLQPSYNVLVENDRITAVTRDPVAADGASVIDVAGRTLMPGLIDAHAHVTGLSLSPKNLAYPTADVVMAAAAYLRNSLMAGFTTIREAGGADYTLAHLLKTGEIVGPGPGILGSATEYGNGGVAALEVGHAALALGLPTLVSPRLSDSDPRPRHRGLSHHTATVLRLLLGSVRVPVPEIDLAGWPTREGGSGRVELPSVLDALHRVCGERHDVIVQPVDLSEYAASGLPTRVPVAPLYVTPLGIARHAPCLVPAPGAGALARARGVPS